MARKRFTTEKDTPYINIVTGKIATPSTKVILGERIRYYRKKAKLTQEELSGKIGIQKNAVSSWELGRTRPDIDNVVELCLCLNITPSQLFAFVGDLSEAERMHMDAYRQLSNLDRRTVDVLTNTLLSADEFRQQECPNLIIKPAAVKTLAAGIGDSSEWDSDIEPVYLHDTPLAQKADFVFTVNGNSMEPKYPDGCHVAVCKALRDSPTPGMVGAFQVDNALFIKQYQEDGLHSFNPIYPTMKCEKYDEILFIGRVVGIFKESDFATPEEIQLFKDLS